MNKYTIELRKILKTSEIEAKENKDELIGTEHILLSLLNTKNSLTPTLNELGITYNLVKNEIPVGNNNKDYVFYKNEFLKILEDIIIKKNDLEEEITLPSLIYKILEDKDTNAYKILNNLNVDINKLKKNINLKNSENKVLLIKELGSNLTEEAKNNELDKVIGRDKEIERVIEILARKNKNNPILIGDAGVGKTAIVEELARRIVNDNVPPFLKGKEIISLNLASVISGTKYRGEFEEKLSKIIKELETSPNLIVFIDEIHTLVGAGGAEGAIDASNILKPALARGKIKCIGATTNNEFKTTIEKDKALERRFQKIYINEPSSEETKYILKKIKKDYEKYHNVIIPDSILDLTIKLSKKYIKDRYEPDKSIDILDEMCASASIIEKKNNYNKLKNKIDNLNKEKNIYLISNDFVNASITKEKINELNKKIENIKVDNRNKVTINTLKKVLETKTNSTIYELEDLSYLKKLNSYLKSKVIGQNNAIDKLTSITEYYTKNTSNNPISILLKGSVGTGKTYLIEEYAKYLKLNLIKLDMSDFTNETSVNKIIGSPAGYVGYDEKNTILEKIKNFPLSIILVEDYLISHNKVQNLFNNILETGVITLSNNTKIDLSNALFVFSTKETKEKNNIGFITNNKDTENTFTYTITLNDLKEEDIRKIIKNNNNLSKEDIDKIILKSNYKTLGAKKINNLIRELHQSLVNN